MFGYEEELEDRKNEEIKKLQRKIKRLEKTVKDLKAKTGYTNTIAYIECNNCGHRNGD